MVGRLVEAQYEDGVLRPAQPLSLRSGERVNLIILRCPDSARWDLARLAKVVNGDEVALAERGLAEWVSALEEEEKERN
jgi:predicted DNA-binding antitoxin AbrB/MazE fold protein